MWLPDTNVWIRYLNPHPSPVKDQFRRHPAGRIFLCGIVQAELYFGAWKSARRDENLALLEKLARVARVGWNHGRVPPNWILRTEDDRIR
ncbi:MAG: type II toxin-antitoxin system VapC family toxin [Methylococcales bacterium]